MNRIKSLFITALILMVGIGAFCPKSIAMAHDNSTAKGLAAPAHHQVAHAVASCCEAHPDTRLAAYQAYQKKCANDAWNTGAMRTEHHAFNIIIPQQLSDGKHHVTPITQHIVLRE